MSKFALGVGEVDELSAIKIERLKRKYPELTYSIYCLLAVCGVSDTQIRKMYELSYHAFYFFKKEHHKVLKEVRNWT